MAWGPGELQGRDVTISDCSNCTFYFLDVVGAVHLRDLSKCAIWTGCNSSSVLAYDCRQCRIVAACRQLRIHQSSSLIVCACTASSPIIEKSVGVCFAPYCLEYPSLKDHWKEAGLGDLDTTDTNGAWQNVQDFDWLKRQASPNWVKCDASESKETLRLNVVAAGSGDHADSTSLPTEGGLWVIVNAPATNSFSKNHVH